MDHSQEEIFHLAGADIGCKHGKRDSISERNIRSLQPPGSVFCFRENLMGQPERPCHTQETFRFHRRKPLFTAGPQRHCALGKSQARNETFPGDLHLPGQVADRGGREPVFNRLNLFEIRRGGQLMERHFCFWLNAELHFSQKKSIFHFFTRWHTRCCARCARPGSRRSGSASTLRARKSWRWIEKRRSFQCSENETRSSRSISKAVWMRREMARASQDDKLTFGSGQARLSS